MIVEKQISFAALQECWRQILKEIVTAADGEDPVVYLVTVDIPDGAGGTPAGMVTDDTSAKFVLGPGHICGRVLGLYDMEYGWPAFRDLDRVRGADDLEPGRHHHPIIRCPAPDGAPNERPSTTQDERYFNIFLAPEGGRAVACVMISEYRDILERLAKNSGIDSCT